MDEDNDDNDDPQQSTKSSTGNIKQHIHQWQDMKIPWKLHWDKIYGGKQATPKVNCFVCHERLKAYGKWAYCSVKGCVKENKTYICWRCFCNVQ